MPSTSSFVEPGVLERELDRLDGGVADRPADVLGERQMADADDGHPILDAPEEIAVDGLHWHRSSRDVVSGSTGGRRQEG